MTFLSKNILNVRLRPLIISVRNNVCAVWSNAALNNSWDHAHHKYPKLISKPTIKIKRLLLQGLQDVVQIEQLYCRLMCKMRRMLANEKRLTLFLFRIDPGYLPVSISMCRTHGSYLDPYWGITTIRLMRINRFIPHTVPKSRPWGLMRQIFEVKFDLQI